MEINCYRRSKQRVTPRYVAFFGGVTTEAGDLSELSKLLEDYVKSEPNKILLLGGIKEDEKDSKSRALPKRVLEELAIILENKTKREVLIT